MSQTRTRDKEDENEMRAQFELYEDEADEWRWRLRVPNGNIIADSGQGYTRKENARKGIRSVKRNAISAEIVEETDG